MYKEGYTVFTGPVKHGAKGDQAIRKAEKAGHQIEYIKKSDHANKNQKIEGKKVAKIMNDEDDHKRKSFLIKLPPYPMT